MIDKDSVDAGDLFDLDVDINAKGGSSDPKVNAFAGIEEKLGLPFGSTKSGIKDAKAEVKSIKDEAKQLKVETEIAARKEHLVALPSASFSMDDLAADRARLRESYMRLLDRGMDMLNKIQGQLDILVNPDPDEYGAWQKQYLAVLKTMDSIRAALVTFRQEEDLKNIKVSQSGGTAEIASGDVPSPESGDAIEVTSQVSNAWIKEWTAELDKNIKEEIAADHSSRLAAKAVAAIGKEGE